MTGFVYRPFPPPDPTEPSDDGDDSSSFAGEALGCLVWILLFGFLVAGILISLYRGPK
jgi:hypothetical protein